jgi:succinate dehydrogenase / fumarate reductase cytochrome b subunit
MNWFIDLLRTSIGKKLLMAFTGMGFCVFLFIHLIGNLTLYGGKDFFLSYVEHLHALGPLIIIAECGLLLFAVIHVTTGIILFIENWRARPVGYLMKKNAGGRTIGSATMPYTGILILAFIIIHLLNVHFVDLSQQTVFQVLKNIFSFLPYVVFYTLAVIIVAIHVSHGFWSLFQTLGANHPKYMPFIQGIGIGFSIIIALGFGFIPAYIRFIA